MHILFIVPYTPNLIRTRPYNLVRQLAHAGQRVTLLTLYTNEGERDDLERLSLEGITVVAESLTRKRSLTNAVTALPTPEPLQAAYCWHPTLANHIDALLHEDLGNDAVDLVHVEHLRGARYALRACSLTNRDGHRQGAVPVIWDSVDCISHLFRQASIANNSLFGRWLTRFELPRTEHFEGWLAWQFSRVLTTSPVDRDALLQLATDYRVGCPPVEVLANGVDLDYFCPDPNSERQPATLVLSGKMSYHANVSMALYLVKDVMPRVWDSRPDVSLTIVGKDPTAAIRSLAEEPRITVTGTVADVRPYLRSAAVAVAPIAYGAGIQNKVLEAMACETPVVATPAAARALSVVAGQDLLIGRDAEEFAEAILSLLSDASLRASIGARGRAYVERHHRWEVIARQLLSIYDGVRRQPAQPQ